MLETREEFNEAILEVNKSCACKKEKIKEVKS